MDSVMAARHKARCLHFAFISFFRPMLSRPMRSDSASFWLYKMCEVFFSFWDRFDEFCSSIVDLLGGLLPMPWVTQLVEDVSIIDKIRILCFESTRSNGLRSSILQFISVELIASLQRKRSCVRWQLGAVWSMVNMVNKKIVVVLLTYYVLHVALYVYIMCCINTADNEVYAVC